MYRKKIFLAVIFSLACASVSADTASDIEKAKRFGDLMKTLGATVTVDPDYSGTEAKFVYRLDGSTISCTRGITHGIFSHSCSRMNERLRNRVNLARIQSGLKEKGYEIGKIDGIFGKMTSAAISAYQKDNGILVTGEPSTDLLLQLY